MLSLFKVVHRRGSDVTLAELQVVSLKVQAVDHLQRGQLLEEAHKVALVAAQVEDSADRRIILVVVLVVVLVVPLNGVSREDVPLNGHRGVEEAVGAVLIVRHFRSKRILLLLLLLLLLLKSKRVHFGEQQNT